MARSSAASASAPSKARISRQRQRRSLVVRLIVALTLLILAALYSVTSELSLRPVFGSNQVPSQGHIFAILAFVFGLLARKASPKTATLTILQTVPLHAFTIPSILHYVVSPNVERLGLTLAPLFIQALTLFPLLLLSFYCTLALVDDDGTLGGGGTADEFGFTATAYAIFYALKLLFDNTIPLFMGQSLLLTRWGLQLFVASCYAVLLPLKKMIQISPAVVPALAFAFFSDPHAPFESSLRIANSTLARHDFALLDRQESSTGYISVIDFLGDHFRVLRCDHSLLGGLWLPTPKRVAEGIIVPETIYTVFTMLEAVRLMESSGSSEKEQPSSPGSALVLGLGIGTSPAALVAHGIKTTAVEVDPVVTKFAKQYFNLPSNLTVINDDAKRFLKRDSEQYDMIIHDVFTGGVEPVHLFTSDFLLLLKDTLKPEGRIAINYVGNPTSFETSLVLSGIDLIFEGCRFFSDEPVSESNDSDMVNIVAFCTKDPLPWKFRKPKEADFLGSQSRRQFLLPQHEIAPPKKTESGKHPPILNKMNAHVLEKNHPEQARGHWKVMRGVLPAIVWETW